MSTSARARTSAAWGKGARNAATPLDEQAVTVLRDWLATTSGHDSHLLFPSRRQGRLTRDAVPARLARYHQIASRHARPWRLKPSPRTRSVTRWPWSCGARELMSPFSRYRWVTPTSGQPNSGPPAAAGAPCKDSPISPSSSPTCPPPLKGIDALDALTRLFGAGLWLPPSTASPDPSRCTSIPAAGADALAVTALAGIPPASACQARPRKPAALAAAAVPARGRRRRPLIRHPTTTATDLHKRPCTLPLWTATQAE